MRNATLEEKQSIHEHIDEKSMLTGINFWNILNDDEFDERTICKHIECPYKDCNYHRHTTNKYADLSLFELEYIPDYIPKTQEEVECCMRYIDI